MPKESFVVYLDFEKTLRQFTQEEALEMFWAFFEYNRTGVVPTFSSRLLEVCWIRFQTQFDRDAEKYENVSGIVGLGKASEIAKENFSNLFTIFFCKICYLNHNLPCLSNIFIHGSSLPGTGSKANFLSMSIL